MTPPPLANVFQPLINVFEATLKVFHDDIGMSWGLAIIALTVLIRSLLLPLTLKQARSMHRIAQLTPEIQKLRLKHGSDPQRLQHETMAFYREHKINPLASLLPALAQLPVFLALYYTLRTDLRHDICPAINPPARQPRTRAAKRRHRTSSSSPTSRAGPRAPSLPR